MRTRAHSGSAILLLADRFSPSSHQEDLGLQFQVRMLAQSAPVPLPVSDPAQERCAEAPWRAKPIPPQCLPLATPKVVGWEFNPVIWRAVKDRLCAIAAMESYRKSIGIDAVHP